MKKELDLLAGHFLDGILPKNKEYLLHYFKGKRLIMAIYLLTFPYDYQTDYFQNFTNHTGIYTCLRNMFYINNELRCIEHTLKTAMENNDYQLVNEIRTGMFKPRCKVKFKYKSNQII
jgi:hypothetical protein